MYHIENNAIHVFVSGVAAGAKSGVAEGSERFESGLAYLVGLKLEALGNILSA